MTGVTFWRPGNGPFLALALALLLCWATSARAEAPRVARASLQGEEAILDPEDGPTGADEDAEDDGVSPDEAKPAPAEESISDEEDEEEGDDDANGQTRAAALTLGDPADPGAAEPAGMLAGAIGAGTVFTLRAETRFAVDVWHERPPPESYRGYQEDVMELWGHAVASLEHKLRPWMKLKLGGRLLYRLTTRRPAGEGVGDYYLFNGQVNRSEFEAGLLDTYVQLSSSWIDLQAGLLTEVWGATDLSNPNDVMSARDLRSGPFVDPETARLPSLTLRAEAELAGFTVSASWVPLFNPHRVDTFGSDYASCGPAAPPFLQWLGELAGNMVDDSLETTLQRVLLQTSLPRPWEDSALGVRISRELGGWDLALQWAWLFERQPAFRVRPDLSILPLVAAGPRPLTTKEMQTVTAWLLQNPAPIEGVYHRLHHAGASLSGTLWSLVLNLDLAYQSRTSALLGGAAPLKDVGDGWYASTVESQTLAHTVGVTYTRGESLLITVEWWHRVLLDLAAQHPAVRPELLMGGPHFAGLGLLLRYKLSSVPLTFAVAVHSDLLNPSVILSPQVAYRIGGHIEISAGADIYEGVRASLGGKLSQNDQVFLGLKAFL
jgi:hypothetical protein